MISPSRCFTALTALLAVAPPAMADTAKLTISGRVSAGTCVLTAAPIALDAVKANVLKVGDHGLKNGTLALNSCVGVTKAKLTFEGIAADADVDRWKNTAGTDAAKGVSIVLLSGATGSDNLKKGDSVGVAVTGATASYALRAGYHVKNLAELGTGVVESAITVTAAYE